MLSSETADIVLRSLYISGVATLISLSWSVPASYALALKRSAGFIEALMETLVGMPTVLLGLLLYFLFSSSGPLASLRLLYTPQAMIIGEAILVTPLIVSTSYRMLRNSVTSYFELALSLGASRPQMMGLVLRETAPGILASAIMGFSRAVGELGVAMMVGGNISGYTRVATTTIALGVSRGEFEEAVVLGIILLTIMIVVAMILKYLSKVYEGW
ncbi:MAG: ABC transporter permease [Zestosphaera sp.]